MLKIKDLFVEVEGKEIIKGISLEIKPGEKVALMGKNGSGKTSLSNALMGNPRYKITKGKILLDNKEITKLPPEERAKLGLFLSFQNPVEIPGVTLAQFLRLSYNAINKEKLSVMKFSKLLKEKMKLLNIPEAFEERYLNEGFSGGEKKKAEILQLTIINPKYAILDETDSGLDVDALKTISKEINLLSKTGLLIITHYNRLLKEIKPDRVLVIEKGKVIKEGTASLALELENEGFKIIE